MNPPLPAINLSIVIPTYGGAESLVGLVDRIANVMTERGLSWEVIVVNDASPDGTWAVLEEIRRRHPALRAIDLLHNHGQATATLCGLSMAQGTLVATIDDDLQHPPEELLILLDELERHPEWDAVVGTWDRDDRSLRNLGSWLHQMVDRLVWDTPRGFRHTSFRVMRRPVVDALTSHETRTPVLSPMLLQTTRNVHNVRVEHHPRAAGRSGYSIRKALTIVLDNLLQGSTLPLKLLARFGLAATVLAVIVGTLLVVRWAIGIQTPPGWASSLLAVVFFGGATLLGIGLLGEYTMLIIREVRQPPRWAVRATLGCDAAGSARFGSGVETRIPDAS